MFLAIGVLVVSLVSVQGFAGGLRGEKGFGIEPVSDFNVTQYLGRWFQTHTDLLANATYEANAVCVVADYGLNANGSVSVRNSENVGSATGPRKEIFGYASVDDPSDPAKLTVYLQGVPVGAPYWVVLVGPIVDGKYDWAVVSDGLEVSLFVLTRDVQRFRAQYEKHVLQELAAMGFTEFWNKPIPTSQAGCNYLPPPTM